MPASIRRQVVLPLEDQRVEAELAQPAERDEAQRPRRLSRAIRVHEPRSAATGRAPTPTEGCANSTTDSVSARREPSMLSNLKCSLRLG